MLRLAVLTARGRTGAFTGALIALFAAAVLSMAWGMQLESILRTHAPVERYAAAAAVVTGQQSVGRGDKVLLTERARLSSALVARLAAVPGVRSAVGDVSVPAELGGTAAVAHGWAGGRATAHPRARGAPPRGAGRGRPRPPRHARHAADPRRHRSRALGHGRRRRPAFPPRHPAGGDLPDGRGGHDAGRPS